MVLVLTGCRLVQIEACALCQVAVLEILAGREVRLDKEGRNGI